MLSAGIPLSVIVITELVNFCGSDKFMYEKSEFSGVYCETEAFNASCEMGFAILMTHARYGRMKLSRCVKQDYGHVGCAADVIDLADVRCSARRKCAVRIPDALFATTKPCPDDLKPYLEAGYVCVKVQTPKDHVCLPTSSTTVNGIRVSNPHTPGYLANLVTQATGCGSSIAPWMINAHKGEQIRITLYDFSVGRHRLQVRLGGGGVASNRLGNDLLSPAAAAAAAPVSEASAFYAQPLAVIRDMINERNLTIFGGKSRETLVYTSMGHALEIVINTIDDVIDIPYFLLKYEVIGCPDDHASVRHGWSVRSGDRLTVRCNNTTSTVHTLQCIKSKWVGEVIDCAPGVAPANTRTEEAEYVSVSNGMSVIIAVLTAIAIGLAVLGLGLLLFRR